MLPCWKKLYTVTSEAKIMHCVQPTLLVASTPVISAKLPLKMLGRVARTPYPPLHTLPVLGVGGGVEASSISTA